MSVSVILFKRDSLTKVRSEVVECNSAPNSQIEVENMTGMNGYYKLVTVFTVCNERRMIYEYYGLYPDSYHGSEKLLLYASSPASTRSPASSYSTNWGWGYSQDGSGSIEPDCVCDSKHLASVGHQGGCKWLSWKQKNGVSSK